jgi:hypothetical protein
VSQGAAAGKEKGRTAVGDDVWIGVGDLECELIPLRDEGTPFESV